MALEEKAKYRNFSLNYMQYSIIVPVYNRLDEVKELLESAEKLNYPRNEFEILFVDDGSTDGFRNFIHSYKSNSGLIIRYLYQSNQGPGKARNEGMKKGEGDFFIFFDSDCLLPPEYLQTLSGFLQINSLDVFGGSDAAHDSFSKVQKAINYAMTSFFTTGGIRGNKKQLNKFQPRSFNMGVSKSVFKDVGGFSSMHPGEDPDLSLRIREKGYRIGFVPGLTVYHKRRINFKKFTQQVYKFGLVRNILFKWHPESFSIVFFLPAFFLLGSLLLLVLGVFFSPWFLLPFVLLLFLLFVDSFIRVKNFHISLMAVIASLIQLYSYGFGFCTSFLYIFLLKKDEREAFPRLFFDRKK